MNNLADELKISISGKIAEQYQQFIDKFKTIKVEYSNYYQVKAHFWELKRQTNHSDRAN